MRIKILLLVAIGCAAYWGVASLSLQKKLEDTQLQLSRMETHATQLEKRVLSLEQELAESKSKSIDRIVDDANTALKDGWEGLLKEFDERVEELRDKIQQDLGGAGVKEDDDNDKT